LKNKGCNITQKDYRKFKAVRENKGLIEMGFGLIDPIGKTQNHLTYLCLKEKIVMEEGKVQKPEIYMEGHLLLLSSKSKS